MSLGPSLLAWGEVKGKFYPSRGLEVTELSYLADEISCDSGTNSQGGMLLS